MPSNLSQVTGTQVLFNKVDSYSPATLNNLELGTPIDVEIDLTSVQAGEAEGSAKADLTATWAPSYAVHAAIEFATEPVTGTYVEFYWAPSVSGTAGQGNPGYVTGTSVPYTGTPGTLAEGLAQLTLIGVMACGADATGSIQTAYIGKFSPPTRYGTLVVYNATADHFHNAVDEMAVSFTPIIPQSS